MNSDQRLVFSFRKLSVGLAGVAIASLFLISNNPQKVKAATATGTKEVLINKQADPVTAHKLNTIVLKAESEKPLREDEVEKPSVPASDKPKEAGTTIPKQPAHEGDNIEVGINYDAKKHTGKIIYVDENGKQIGTTDLTGKTGEDVAIKPVVPAGWVISNGQNIPKSEKATAEGLSNITVKIEHNKITVEPDDPKKTTDKLPDVEGNFPSGVDKDDLNKTVTRTINVTGPDGKKQEHKDSASLKRSATVDEISKEVKYGAWSTDKFKEFTTPKIDGYTASRDNVPAEDVTGETKDSTIEITYNANDQTTHIVYKDKKGNEIKTDTVTGKTDETVKTNSSVPAGWELDGSQAAPGEITFKGANTPDTVITIKHGTVEVDHDKPAKQGDAIPGSDNQTYPDGLTENDLNSKGVRKIVFEWPAGYDPATSGLTFDKGSDNTITQTVNFYRDAVVDTVTGKITGYKVDGKVVSADKSWLAIGDGNYPEVQIPTIPGYTVKVEKVKTDGPKPVLMVMISFVANPATKPGADNKPAALTQPIHKDHQNKPADNGKQTNSNTLNDHDHQTNPVIDNQLIKPVKTSDQSQLAGTSENTTAPTEVGKPNSKGKAITKTVTSKKPATASQKLAAAKPANPSKKAATAQPAGKAAKLPQTGDHYSAVWAMLAAVLASLGLSGLATKKRKHD